MAKLSFGQLIPIESFLSFYIKARDNYDESTYHRTSANRELERCTYLGGTTQISHLPLRGY